MASGKRKDIYMEGERLNLQYLESLPEVNNIHNFQLEPGEKAVYVTSILDLGNEKGIRLGRGMVKTPFTLTNRRIFVKTDVVSNDIWTFDLDNIQELSRVDTGRLKLFKGHHYRVLFRKPIIYRAPKNIWDSPSFYNKIVDHELPEAQFYFQKEDEPAFEEILHGLNT